MKNLLYFKIPKENCLLIAIYMLFFVTTAISQIDCGTEEVPSGFGMLTSPCIDMDIDEVPVKTIRVSFHIFQKDDGSENIQYDAAGNDYLDAIEWSMNHYMINLPMFDYTTSSPYYTDSKIRYEVVKKTSIKILRCGKREIIKPQLKEIRCIIS